MPEDPIQQRLFAARKNLLDLTARNRLLNTPASPARSTRLEIVDGDADSIFHALVRLQRKLSFRGIASANVEGVKGCRESLFDDDEPDEGRHRGQADAVRLCADLTPEKLNARLLKLCTDARTFEEEQGVNILYLAIGFLRWYEDDNSRESREAPLVLVPVRLERGSVGSPFYLRAADDDLVTNVSLQARLKNDFNIDLPEIGEEEEEFVPTEYFAKVREAVRGQRRFAVVPNRVVLWFFSFAKYLMYRDLDPDNWPNGSILNNPMIRGMIGREPLAPEPPICGVDDPIDDVIRPADAAHVLDADSSQAVVIEEVKRGRNLVIQGPPGTGKSQTIANLICGAVLAGKTVLFVAEKMAALEVVHRRLKEVSLGAMCLELHSHKANKREVLRQLDETLQMEPPAPARHEALLRSLTETVDRLNGHVRFLHQPLAPSGRTPHQVLGTLVRLGPDANACHGLDLPVVRNWSHDDLCNALRLLEELAARCGPLGTPNQHPWRGVEAAAMLPMDRDALMDQLRALAGGLESLMAAAERLASLLRLDPPRAAREIAALGQLTHHLTLAPPCDRSALAHEAWERRRDAIEQLVADGQRLTSLRERLRGAVRDTAWATDARPARNVLASWGRSWFRWFSPEYWRARSTLRETLAAAPPRDLASQLKLLDTLIEFQAADAIVQSADSNELGAQAFGTAWQGARSDWNALRAVVDWARETPAAPWPRSPFKILADLPDGADVQTPLAAIRAELRPCVERWRDCAARLQLNLVEAFGTQDDLELAAAELRARVDAWLANPQGLAQWIDYRRRRNALDQLGLRPLINRLETGELSPARAPAALEGCFFSHACRQFWHRLDTFRGSERAQTLANFRSLDVARIRSAAEEVAAAHYRQIPRGASYVGELGIVRTEIKKKRRHLSIRELLGRAGRAIQQIKPVFLMSPISVAQFLKPGALTFDLLVIDEASQVLPVDALGAVARSQQIVVVGDDKQLPPTQFFSRVLGDEEAEANDESPADVESILGLCCARGMEQRTLRWHYRSQHHSLIALSNREFYESRLYVVPSPHDPTPELGLTFTHVPHGVYDRSGSRTNRVEARVVAEAVLEHARTQPHLTLGVGCFSVAQRDAILDELELLRRKDPAAEPFFTTDPDPAARRNTEPFFVKNLENIQGDERDVILISVGYGFDQDGRLTMNFGPLSTDGGERRLNVMMTRARQRCQVFSSIKAENIDLHGNKSRGAQVLHAFLRYAETGLLDAGQPTGREHDSEFERQVHAALAARGYRIEPQVGVAGFFIDLAVVHPQLPGRYVLGIECDGANYHRARSARDRDRLRAEILERRGWKLHRIWSTDWFNDPSAELQRAVEAIEASLRQGAIPPAPRTAPRIMAHPRTVRAPRVGEPPQDEDPPAAPYKVSSLRVSLPGQPHEVPIAELARIVARIVDEEGPIHEEEIARRVTEAFGLRRIGNRIREAVRAAILLAQTSRRLESDNGFVDIRGRTPVRIRNRGNVEVPTLRKPEMLPPSEIREAALQIVRHHLGVELDELIKEVSLRLGFKALGSQLRERIEGAIRELLRQGLIEEQLGRLYVDKTTPRDDSLQPNARRPK